MNQLVGGGHVGRDQGVKPLHRRNAGVRFLNLISNVCWPTHLGRIPDLPKPAKRPPRPSNGDRKARLGYKGGMRAVLKTIDPVVLNFATNLLSQEGIESVVFDTHASIMEGSMGFFIPRRLMVRDEDFAQADELLRAAVPEAM
jgi:putative signal transducing protein